MLLFTLRAIADPTGPFTDATWLGHLLHKHPDRTTTTKVPGGTATSAWPEATPEAATFMLAVDLDRATTDPGRYETPGLDGWINTARYAAGRYLATAIGRALRSACAGRCDTHPQLTTTPIGLTATIYAVPTGPQCAQDRFARDHWQVATVPAGAGHTTVTASGRFTVAAALTSVRQALTDLDPAPATARLAA